MRTHVICVPALVVCSFLLILAPAAVADQIDQSFVTPPFGGVGAPFLAQVFTAGTTGFLTGVNINANLSANYDVTGPHVISINTVSIWGLPTSTVLTSTTLPSPAPNNNLLIDLSVLIPLSPTPVTAGQQYAIVLTSLGGTGAEWYVADGYPGGVPYYSFDGQAWTQPGNYDFNFQTYVRPVPEPGTLLLVGTGIVVTGLRRKLKKARNFHLAEVTKF